MTIDIFEGIKEKHASEIASFMGMKDKQLTQVMHINCGIITEADDISVMFV